ncbi:hypothetical protein KA005_73815, partial [bacterium]|nr:hypothetical protein [bacterium]
MPQIYRGFDIDTIIFYRGINTPKSEYVMEAPDGSRVTGCRFGALSRFSYYFYVYRMVRYGMSRDEWWYDWDRGALPFRLCNEYHPNSHYYILDPHDKQWNENVLPEQLKKLVDDESQHFSTSHIACMQGFDTSNPDPKESEIIKLCQDAAPDHEIRLSNLKDYMDEMRKEITNPTVLYGESRDPGSVGKYTHLFGDVISARTRLKIANHKAEIELQRKAELWSAIGSMIGGEYLRSAIERAWTLLLKNHPHDTISGAGIDQMEKDSLYRTDQINIISAGVARRGMQSIQLNIDNSDLTEKDSVLTIFNPTPFKRREVISILIDLPENMGYKAFSIQIPQGKKALLQNKRSFSYGTLVRNLQDISLELKSQRFHCHFETDEIPAFGYKTYHIVREDKTDSITENLLPKSNTLENEYLLACFNG